MTNIRNIFFYIGLAAVVVMLVTFDVSFSQLWDSIAQAGWWLVGIGVLWLVLYAMNAVTWLIILKGSGDVPISYGRLFKFTLSGFALNYATPVGLLGGEPYKIMELTPYVGTERATSSVVLFAMTHIFAHFWYWVTAIVLCLFFMTWSSWLLLVLGLASLFCAAGIYFFIRGYKNGLVERLVRWVGGIPFCRGWSTRLYERHATAIAQIDGQIAQLMGQNRSIFFWSLALEYVGRMMQSLEITFLLLLFHTEGSITQLFLQSVIILAFTSLFANLLFFIPLQLGGREGGFAMSTAGLGMTNALGLFISIICRVRELFFTIIGLLLMKIGTGTPCRSLRCCISFSFLLASAGLQSAYAQTTVQRFADIDLTVEASATATSGDAAPLWLTSNRYGLSSIASRSAYERVTLLRPLCNDSLRQWRLGYGVDIAVGEGHERTIMLQQAFVEAQWKVFKLRLGSKQEPLVTQNDELSSGALSMGINARPVPQLRFDVDWFSIPGTHDWWQWRFYGSYGMFTDGAWQKQWVNPTDRYTSNTLYHEKALYWKFGNEKKFPFTYQIALRMAAQFGGTSYNFRGRNYEDGATVEHPVNLRTFWNILTCSGSDETDGSDPNTAGNHVGSYIMQLRYHGSSWQARAYWERFFEDQSMLTVQYGIRDMLIGAEVNFPSNPWISTAVVEHISTTDQSGAVYHDYTKTIPDKMNGRDDYYNHNIYTGWQHYGQTLGNPLLTSPIYNGAYEGSTVAGKLFFYNNRIKALHFALAGDPSVEWHWRIMASFTRNLGIYSAPLIDPKRQTYLFAELAYRPRWAEGWIAKVGVAHDNGGLLVNSTGMQFTISKKIK
ncbi:MAG: flippase-like domain-containing protein [Bacteroidaceae bacterium]|nr:flippase-like domain-containing protein [Bacteroidaceae bacterium]